MYIPKLVVKKIDINFNVNFICDLLDTDFLAKNKSLPFAQRVFGLFPELKKQITENTTKDEIYIVVDKVVRNNIIINDSEIEKRITQLQYAFDQFYEPLMEKMLELFELEWDIEQKEITCFLGCCPVFPRHVLTKEFYVNYSTVDERILKAGIHEINHFVLFEKWKSMHGYTSNTEPECPETLWLLEEIAVDPTLNETCLQMIAPYPQKAYS